jgi:hypothetical protein
MSESVKTITTTDYKNEENGTFRTIKIIHTYWNNMPSNFRRFMSLYVFISAVCYALYNYNDGKNALLNYRRKRFSNNALSSIDEWNAIKDGINSFDNFWNALFFPWSFFGKIMPFVVLLLNPSS